MTDEIESAGVSVERQVARIKAFTEKPLAAPGFTSYRYQGNYGWIMIGAKDDAGALNEAGRSLSYGKPTLDRLQIYNGQQYVFISSHA